MCKEDRIRNGFIREALEILSKLEVIEQQQLKWVGQVVRVENSLRFTQKKILKKKEASRNKPKALARNKKKWSHFIYKH